MTKKYKTQEGQNQSVIIDFLLAQQAQGALLVQRTNNSPTYDSIRHCYRKLPKGAAKGFPDIYTIIRGYPVHFEVKSDRGVQSPFQKEMQSKIENAGGYYFIVRNVFEVIQKVRFFYKQKELERVC